MALRTHEKPVIMNLVEFLKEHEIAAKNLQQFDDRTYFGTDIPLLFLDAEGKLGSQDIIILSASAAKEVFAADEPVEVLKTFQCTIQDVPDKNGKVHQRWSIQRGGAARSVAFSLKW